MTVIINGYIMACDSPIPNDIQEALNRKPETPNGYVCRLRADTLEWELYELPAIEETEAPSYTEEEQQAYNDGYDQAVLDMTEETE